MQEKRGASRIRPMDDCNPPTPKYVDIHLIGIICGLLTVGLEICCISYILLITIPNFIFTHQTLFLFLIPILCFCLGALELILFLQFDPSISHPLSLTPGQEISNIGGQISKLSDSRDESEKAVDTTNQERNDIAAIPLLQPEETRQTKSQGPLAKTSLPSNKSVWTPDAVTSDAMALQSSLSVTCPSAPYTRSYSLPREGDNLELSADKSSANRSGTRYALADGVGTSFLPGKWAQIITQRFVNRNNNFDGQADFEQWLGQCSEEWHRWVKDIWVPRTKERSGQEDWSREIARGASATFVGCSFTQTELVHTGATNIDVTVVGDAEFFLVSPSSGHWKHQSFYLEHPEQFAQTTETLGSPEKRVKRDWKRVHTQNFHAHQGDYIVLATDALALWILQQIQSGIDPWQTLFSIHDTKTFRHFVHHYRSSGELEVDDTTIIIIPLHSETTIT